MQLQPKEQKPAWRGSKVAWGFELRAVSVEYRLIYNVCNVTYEMAGIVTFGTPVYHSFSPALSFGGESLVTLA